MNHGIYDFSQVCQKCYEEEPQTLGQGRNLLGLFYYLKFSEDVTDSKINKIYSRKSHTQLWVEMHEHDNFI